MPLVSLVMPIYNGEKTLKRSIESILNQTFQDYELILVNDGSTDSSQDICKNYVNQDCRIKLITTPNKGSGSARNTGIENARGKYIMFPDCDDWLEKNMIEKMIGNIVLEGVDFVICGSKIYDENLKLININLEDNHQKHTYLGNEEVMNNYLAMLEKGLALGPSDKIYSLDIIKKNNIKFPELRRSQDIVFNLNYFKKSNGLVLLNKCLYNYVQGEKETVYKKLPENYIQIVEYISKCWFEIMKNNEQLNQRWKDYLSCYIFSSIYIFMSSLYSSHKTITKQNINQYVDDILNSDIIQEIVSFNCSYSFSSKIYSYSIKNSRKRLFLFLIRCRMLKDYIR